jgi:hypothetical protein
MDFNGLLVRQRGKVIGRRWMSGVKVERVGPTCVRFTCPHGHRSTHDYARGPIAKRMPAEAMSFMVRYWADRVTHVCRQCVEDQTT